MRYTEIQENLTQYYLGHEPELIEQLKPYWERIQVECSDIIDIMHQTKQCLYRGVSGKPLVFEATPRVDRNPMSSSNDGQYLYDLYLERLGIKARRQSSIFVITNRRTAKGFGHLNVIFPKNGANFCWSETHDDIIVRNFHMSNVVNIPVINQMLDQLYDKRIEVVWDSEDLFASIERMKQALGNPELGVWDFVDFEKMDNVYQARDTDLAKAMLMDQYTGWEIMIGSSYFGMSALAYSAFLAREFPDIESLANEGRI